MKQSESVAVQVPENTVDLRGMQGDEALDMIEDAMQVGASLTSNADDMCIEPATTAHNM